MRNWLIALGVLLMLGLPSVSFAEVEPNGPLPPEDPPVEDPFNNNENNNTNQQQQQQGQEVDQYMEGQNQDQSSENTNTNEQGQDQGQDQGQQQGQGQAQGQGQGQAMGQGQLQKGEVNGNFSGNTTNTVVNPNLDFDDYRPLPQAARVSASESGCHTGVSATGQSIGGSLGGPTVSCDAANALNAMAAANEQGQYVMAELVKWNFYVKAFFRPLLTVATLGLL